jgi:hypothetical protein
MRLVRALLVAVLVTVTVPVARAQAHYPNQVTRWRDEAIAAGWSTNSWPWLRCIIHRESRGDPGAYNGADPNGGSRGLTQINGIHTAWLKQRGIIRFARDLYHPTTNLKAARLLYRAAGPRAWGGKCR